jgi:small-conductance mechanosensitive channel
MSNKLQEEKIELPELTEEQKAIQERAKKEIEKLNEMSKMFIQSLINEGFMTEIIEIASESVRNKAQTMIFKTKGWKEMNDARAKFYSTTFRDLEMQSDEELK